MPLPASPQNVLPLHSIRALLLCTGTATFRTADSGSSQGRGLPLPKHPASAPPPALPTYIWMADRSLRWCLRVLWPSFLLVCLCSSQASCRTLAAEHFIWEQGVQNWVRGGGGGGEAWRSVKKPCERTCKAGESRQHQFRRSARSFPSHAAVTGLGKSSATDGSSNTGQS